MSEVNTLKTLNFTLKTAIELNHAYMPFVCGGGLFIPTTETYTLGETVLVHVKLPDQDKPLPIQGKVIWITPKHALYQALQGIGIQFIDSTAKSHCHEIESHLDPAHEVGGYAYWIDEDLNK